ncbi:MAG: hypothetical protein M3Q89_03590, partial [Verrucomicrobiota bacterium]|nr:hypothetical protein [Verrucomicrobiota bacterium]
MIASILLATPAESAPDQWTAQSIPELKQQIESKHPAAYYELAAKLFATEPTKDEAVFWFYLGQLRFRYHLAADPNLPRSGEPALFASVSEVIGRPINEYAGADPEKWMATIDRALQWDKSHPNNFTSKEKAADAYRQIRA